MEQWLIDLMADVESNLEAEGLSAANVAYSRLRRMAYLKRWPERQQMEAHGEAARGFPEKRDLMLEEFDAIRNAYDDGETDADAIYQRLRAEIAANADAIMTTMRKPYTEHEADTWYNQYHEAEEWLADNNYDAFMLRAMVAASGGAWTMAGLSASIMANAEEWKTAVGNVLGQKKAKMVALAALKTEVDAMPPTKTIEDMKAFDTSIAVPTPDIEDKF